jgi:hypothetical protein
MKRHGYLAEPERYEGMQDQALVPSPKSEVWRNLTGVVRSTASLPVNQEAGVTAEDAQSMCEESAGRCWIDDPAQLAVLAALFSESAPDTATSLSAAARGLRLSADSRQ